MTYKILSIDAEKGHVTFVLDDGIEQRVGDFPIEDKEALHAAITRYAEQYVSPVKDQKSLKPEVSAMIGKVTEAKLDVSEKAVSEPAE